MANTFIYDDTDIEQQYDKARELSQETYRAWSDAIKTALPHETISLICDVGCGTGRFTALLAEAFSTKVIGIDPSEKMLEKARQNTSVPDIEFAIGTAEELPLEDASVDALFLSMSYHHIKDTSQALSEFKRVLHKPGYVIIRTATCQSMPTYPWSRFFPTACEIEMNRMPDRNWLIESFKMQEFNLLKHDIIVQQFAVDYLEYFSKISLRGLSVLKAIPDAEFQNGCNRLRIFCEKQASNVPVFEEIDLYAFMW